MKNWLRAKALKWLGLEVVWQKARWGDNEPYQRMLNDWTYKQVIREAFEEERAKREHEAAVVELIAKSKKKQAA